MKSLKESKDKQTGTFGFLFSFKNEASLSIQPHLLYNQAKDNILGDI